MKKKGLIISTLAMVVVLIAALSTATFAWFSSTAQATVEDLNVTTSASEGLRIAMLNGDTYAADKLVSGNLAYNGAWEGDPGFGSSLNFANIAIGNMDNAVTKISKGANIPGTEHYPAPMKGYKVFQVGGSGDYSLTADDIEKNVAFYIATKKTLDYNNAENKVVFEYGKDYDVETFDVDAILAKVMNKPEDKEVVYSMAVAEIVDGKIANPGAGNGICKIETDTWENILTGKFNTETSKLTEDIYLVPTGYDKDVKPTGFELASPNYQYFRLQMAVTNSVDISKLAVAIQLAPTSGNGGTAMDPPTDTTPGKYPGMSAASRLDITAYNTTSTGTVKSANAKPFEQWAMGGNGLFTKPTTPNADGTYDGKYGYSIYNDTTNTLATGNVFVLTFDLWIEGTDNECDNALAGTGFTFKMWYTFAKGTDAIDFKTADIFGTTWGGTIDDATLNLKA